MTICRFLFRFLFSIKLRALDDFVVHLCRVMSSLLLFLLSLFLFLFRLYASRIRPGTVTVVACKEGLGFSVQRSALSVQGVGFPTR